MSKREVVRLVGSVGKNPLSSAIKAGDFLFASGQLGVDKTTGAIPETAADQTRNCLRNFGPILESAGIGYQDVVKVTVYLTDMGDFNGMNEAYAEFFSFDPPARSTVGVQALVKDEYKVEIELIALLESTPT